MNHTAAYGFSRDIPGLFPAATIYNFSPLGELARIANRDFAAMGAIGVAVGALLIALVLAVRARGKHQEHMSLCLFSVAMLFISPLTYLHHMVYLSISVALWLPATIKRGSWATLAAVVVLLGISGMDWPGLYGRMGPLFRQPELQALNLYATVALYCIIVVDYHRADSSSSE
jgi:hypothetical protein